MRLPIPALGLSLVVFLLGCEQTFSVPQGERTVQGVLQSVPVALNRRGTHLLLRGASRVSYVESTEINLRSYEGKEVTLRGTFEPNIDPEELPVFVVKAMLRAEGEELRRVFLPMLRLSLSLPSSWQERRGGDGGIVFTATGLAVPPLRILLLDPSSLPIDFRSLQAKPGNSLQVEPRLVALRRAARARDLATGQVSLYIDRGGDAPASKRVIALLFAPPSGNLDQKRMDPLYEAVMQSVLDDGVAAGMDRLPTLLPGTGGAVGSPFKTPQGKPCGGPAGILCGSGEFCEVTDPETDSGRCRKF